VPGAEITLRVEELQNVCSSSNITARAHGTRGVDENAYEVGMPERKLVVVCLTTLLETQTAR
jgi:hypothetical protein